VKIAVVLGTRPEIVKLSPIVHELQAHRASFFILHTGQHYSFEMDALLFKELKLPRPKYNLHVKYLGQGEQTAKMIAGIEKMLLKEKPDVVVVQGDTNSVLAGALAASKLGIKIAHVEAGLRSFDWRMPEEKNRIITDHLSELLFPPTALAKQNLLDESISKRAVITTSGIQRQKIFVVGNTSVDATLENAKLATKKCGVVLKKLGVKPNSYFLATAHRAENVDDRKFLRELFKTFKKLSTAHGIPVVYPIHPRTAARLKQFRLTREVKEAKKLGLKLIKPLSYLEFLILEGNARLVLTDSGGVVEECCTLRVPCVTMRKSTDRPESVKVGANALGGTESKTIIAASEKMLARKKSWKNPFGDGKSAKRIVNALYKELQ